MSSPTVTLGDVARYVNGFAFKSDDWGDEGMRIIRIQNLNDPTKAYNRTSRVVKDDLRVRQGDLLVSWSASLGVYEWTDAEDAWLNQHIFRVIPDTGRVDRRYLKRALEHVLTGLGEKTQGATMKHLTRGVFLNTELPLPPIDEQRRIAAVLDAADELRAKRREALAKLDTLTRTIFIDMFGDPLANTRGWSKRPFADLCPTTLGKMLDKKQQTGLHLRPYLRNANVRWFGFDLTDLDEMDFDTKARQKYRLEAVDVLICEGGEPGRAAVWRAESVECYFQKALHRGRPDPKLATSDFIVHLLYDLARSGGLLDHISTATIAHLTGKRLKEMEVIAPPLTIQEEFSRRLAAVEAQKLIMTMGESGLSVLAASLQQQAFRGEL